MLRRADLPYVAVIGLGFVFVTIATYGYLALAGDEGLGPGFGRVLLFPFLVLGVVAIVVASVDLFRKRSADEEE